MSGTVHGVDDDASVRPTSRLRLAVLGALLIAILTGATALDAQSAQPAGQPRLWQAYRLEIVGGVVLFVLQACLIAALVIQKRRREAAEAELHAQHAELAHLSRVSLMGELSASLAHELNQPLTAILANAQAAQRFLQAPEPDLTMIREIVDDIASDDRRAGEVIRRLRASMKKGTSQVQDIRYPDVIAEVLRLLKHDLLTREVTVTVDCPADLPVVRGDRIQLQQVLLNLIMNAADAVRDNERGHRVVMVRAKRGDAATIDVSVSDRGHGIAAEQLATIFEPFVTTKSHGLGMGLAICRTIIEDHRGRLWAANNPDAGATFHIVLPTA